MEKLWTTAEVARYLGIEEAGVEALVREGALTGYKLGGQYLRFRPDQVQALKGAARFRNSATAATLARPVGRSCKLREFFYFYDFYVISATLLAVLVVYLIASS
jgi:excisionase family DNA binding protein